LGACCKQWDALWSEFMFTETMPHKKNSLPTVSSWNDTYKKQLILVIEKKPFSTIKST
jgi:hypothetical protein